MRWLLLVKVDVQPALVVKSLPPGLILCLALPPSHGLGVVALLSQPPVARFALLLQPGGSLHTVSSGLPTLPRRHDDRVRKGREGDSGQGARADCGPGAPSHRAACRSRSQRAT